MIKEGGAGNAFFEELHQHKIIRFDELPPQVQYLVNSRLMAMDLATRGTRYCEQLRHSRDPEEVSLLLRGFRRAVPLLAEKQAWPLLLEITRAAAAVPQAQAQEITGIVNPAYFILQDVMDGLNAGLADSTEFRRPVLQLIELGS